MADRVLFIRWGDNVAGREERGLEVFNEALGLYGRMQQEGRIERFDVVLLEANGGDVDGYMELHGSAEQLRAIRDDTEFRRVMLEAGLIVKKLAVCEGYTNAGIAPQIELYQEAIATVPQAT